MPSAPTSSGPDIKSDPIKIPLSSDDSSMKPLTSTVTEAKERNQTASDGAGGGSGSAPPGGGGGSGGAGGGGDDGGKGPDKDKNEGDGKNAKPATTAIATKPTATAAAAAATAAAAAATKAKPSRLLDQIFTKFLDNVNAGKAVADFGPGLVLAIPVLMGIAMVSGMELMPAERLREIDHELDTLTYQIDAERGHLEQEITVEASANLRLSESTTIPAEPDRNEETAATAEDRTSTRPPLDLHETERHAVFRIAELDRDIAKNQRAQRTDFDATNLDELESLIALKSSLTIHQLRLVELRSAYQEKLTLRKKTASLLSNMDFWENNLAAIAGLTVVLGVILSQVNRLLFFEGLFSMFLNRNPWLREQTLKSRRSISVTSGTQAQHQGLISGYYRYAEASINMAVAIFSVGMVYPFYADRLVGAFNETTSLMFTLCSMISLALTLSSFVSFRNYRWKAAVLFAQQNTPTSPKS